MRLAALVSCTMGKEILTRSYLPAPFASSFAAAERTLIDVHSDLPNPALP